MTSKEKGKDIKAGEGIKHPLPLSFETFKPLPYMKDLPKFGNIRFHTFAKPDKKRTGFYWDTETGRKIYPQTLRKILANRPNVVLKLQHPLCKK